MLVFEIDIVPVIVNKYKKMLRKTILFRKVK